MHRISIAPSPSHAAVFASALAAILVGATACSGDDAPAADSVVPDAGPTVDDGGQGKDLGVADVGAETGDDAGSMDLPPPDAGAPLAFFGIAPAFGPVEGGTEVAVQATGLGTGAEVRIGGMPLAMARQDGAQVIRGRVPALMAGAQSVEIRTQGGERITVPDAFRAGPWVPASGLGSGPANDLALDPSGDGLWMTTDFGLYLLPSGGPAWLDRTWTLSDFDLQDLAFAASAPGYRIISGFLDLQSSEDGLAWSRVGSTEERSDIQKVLVTSTNADVQFALEGSVRRVGPNEIPVAFTDSRWRFLTRCRSSGIEARPVPLVQDAFLAADDDRLVILVGNRIYKAQDSLCLVFRPVDTPLVGGTRAMSQSPVGEQVFAVVQNDVYSAPSIDGLWRSVTRPPQPLAGIVAASDSVVYGWTEAPSQVVRSDDGGQGWNVLDIGPVSVDRVFAPDPSNARLVYARAGDDLYVSDNAGADWRLAAFAPVLTVTGFSFDPSTPGALWATSAVGLHRSEDGGAQWADVERTGPREGIVAPQAGGLRALRADGAVEASADGGRSWSRLGVVDNPRQITLGPDDRAYVLDLRRIYAEGRSGLVATSTLAPTVRAVQFTIGGTANDVLVATEAGILRSIDGGQSYLPSMGTEGIRWTAIARSPSNPNRVYASGLDAATFRPRFFRSDDGGQRWSPLAEFATNPASVIQVHPSRPDEVWFGVGFILYQSSDAGENVARANPSVSRLPGAAAVRNGTVRALSLSDTGRVVVGSEGYGVIWRN